MIAKNTQLIRPLVYQFTLGDAKVTTILEGYAHREDMHPFVATNASLEEVKSLAEEYRLPFPAMEHNFVATLIETGGKLVAIDPGFGDKAPMPTAGFFSDGLKLAGYSSEDIDMVLISHCHPDHVGNLLNAGKPTFANAQVILGRTEFDYWQRGENISEMRQPTQALFEKVVLPFADTARFIEPDEKILPGLTSVEAFGHSAGHMCFHFASGKNELLLLNDTVPHYVASFAHPEWHFIMDDFPEQAALTRHRILAKAQSDRVPVIGFHIPFPALGFVETRGAGFEFRPASYQFNIATPG